VLADFCRLARAETNGVIGPQIRQCNRISGHGRGDVLLVELFDGGQVRIAARLSLATDASGF
jgi:hypothetical protein